MLKKPVILFLLLLYICTVSGFGLNLHYCFNRLESVKIGVPANACTNTLACSKMHCCKNSHLDIKVKDSHQAGSTIFQGKFYPLGLPAFALSGLSFSMPTQEIEVSPERGPPLPPAIPIYLKNNIFRI